MEGNCSTETYQSGLVTCSTCTVTCRNKQPSCKCVPDWNCFQFSSRNFSLTSSFALISSPQIQTILWILSESKNVLGIFWNRTQMINNTMFQNWNHKHWNACGVGIDCEPTLHYLLHIVLLEIFRFSTSKRKKSFMLKFSLYSLVPGQIMLIIYFLIFMWLQLQCTFSLIWGPTLHHFPSLEAKVCCYVLRDCCSALYYHFIRRGLWPKACDSRGTR